MPGHSVDHSGFRVQARAAREGVGLAPVRPPEVERTGDRLRDDALFEVRVGHGQERIDARLGAELGRDRELPADALVAALRDPDAIRGVAGNIAGAREVVRRERPGQRTARDRREGRGARDARDLDL